MAVAALLSLHPRSFARRAVMLGGAVALVAAMAACRQQAAPSPQSGAAAGTRAGAAAGTQPGSAGHARCGDVLLADVPLLQAPASMGTEALVAALRDRAAGTPVRLDVTGQRRGDSFVIEMVAAGALAGVRELRLAGNALGPNAMRALADAPGLDCLQRLDVSNNPVTDDGFALLCTAGSARDLAELVVDRADLTGASLARLPGCVWRTSLQDLSLVDNDFSDIDAHAGTGAVTQAAWSRLVSIDLSRTRCRASCLTYLRDAGVFTTLQRFQMEGFFGPAEARILVAGALDRLTTLALIGMADLSEAESDVLGDAGLEILISSPMFAHVASLAVPLHGIGDRGAARLAGSPHGKHLRRLDLRGNAIGDNGARALMDGAYTRDLVHLGLADTLISDDMADALRAHYGPRVLLRE